MQSKMSHLLLRIPHMFGNYLLKISVINLGQLAFVLYYVEICSLFTYFLESFYCKQVLNFVKRFSASFEMIIWFPSFYLLWWCITLVVLKNTKALLHPCYESHLLMAYDTFNILLDLVCWYFVEDFCIYAHQ